MTVTITLNQLPDDILLKIFKYCNSKKCIWKSRGVCKRWYNLLSDIELWRFCNLCDFRLDDNSLCSDMLFNYIPTQQLQFLEVTKKVVRPDIIRSFLQTSSQLRGISLTDCKLSSEDSARKDDKDGRLSHDVGFVDIRHTNGDLKVLEDFLMNNGRNLRIFGK